jgi:hypothetical protein
MMPVHKWRIPVSKTGHYWSVGIFRNREEMWAWMRLLYPRTRKRPVACCIQLKRRSGELHLGYLCFALTHIGAGTVSHEMVHAAIETLSPGRRDRAINEERLASMVDHLTNTFWKRWYRYHGGFQT